MRRFAPLLLILCCGITVSAAAQITQPIAGEGAWSLLRRSGMTPNNALVAEFRDLNPGKFTADGGLRKGVSYRLPSAVVIEPLFGEQYQVVQIQSDRGRGATVYVVPGHGGEDPGAVAYRNGHQLSEDEYAYDISLRVARELMANGVKTHLQSVDTDGIRDTRYLAPDKDETHPDGSHIGRGTSGRLKPRTDAINRLYRSDPSGYQLVLEVHVDARDDPNRQVDIDFFYGSAEGRRRAGRMRETVREKYAYYQPDRGYRGRLQPRGFYTIKHAIPVVTYVELGNIQYRGDQERILDPDNRQSVAEWLAEGILRDIEAHR